jgi:hypothetical protein
LSSQHVWVSASAVEGLEIKYTRVQKKVVAAMKESSMSCEVRVKL